MKITRLFTEKNLPRLIVVLPLITILILSISISLIYIDNIKRHFETESNSVSMEYLYVQKTRSTEWLKQLINLFSYENSVLEENIKKELKNRVDLAYDTAVYIHNKYEGFNHPVTIKRFIQDALNKMIVDHDRSTIWITDYNGQNVLNVGNPIVSKSNTPFYTDRDGRSIVLEEIQMVRKKDEGFITTYTDQNQTQIIYVKRFNHFEWFLGSSEIVEEQRQELRDTMFNVLKRIPDESNCFTLLFEGDELIYLSKNAVHTFSVHDIEVLRKVLDHSQGSLVYDEGKAHVYYEYYAPFDWTVLHGFDGKIISKLLEDDTVVLKQKIADETTFIFSSSFVLLVIVSILSLFFSSRLNKMFANYRELVEKNEKRLEERVLEELHKKQEKEKMLIQQNKMAAMGDMISMIAHQWRQPLNQLSYIFMNVESANEFNELTTEYLNKKLSEGTALLEYMSHTIDDFRRFFTPDKEKENLALSEVLLQAIELIQKSVAAEHIDLNYEVHSEEEVLIYKNEFIQVLFNLINNAKNIIIDRGVKNGKINIQLFKEKENLIVEVIDNAGGVDEKVIDKIFEPYFTTREKGTGLGLYMSKMIVEKHLSGKLSVSNIKKGARFRVMLPASAH